MVQFFPVVLCIHPFPFLPPPPFHSPSAHARPHNVKQSRGFWVKDDKVSEGDSGWSHTALDVASDAEESCTVSRDMGSDNLAVSAVGVPIGNIAPGYVGFPPCLLK